ncbi:hypothetical protein NC652_011127 [Populus alba x Populus x berolinensis]|nr:hypothetical protein NC652_011127 [Populus alba x Populus x berolinensis]
MDPNWTANANFGFDSGETTSIVQCYHCGLKAVSANELDSSPDINSSIRTTISSGRILCKTDKLGQNSKEVKSGHKREIIDTDSSGYGSCCSGDKMPPSKCQKMEKYYHYFSSGDGIASVVAPFLVQSDGLGGPLPLKQLPESPVSINSEFLGVNNESLMNSMENPTGSDQIRSKAADSLYQIDL